MEAEGDSMLGAGIAEGDMLVVEQAIEPQNGWVVVAMLDGGRTVKVLDIRKDGTLWLMPRNSTATPTRITEDSDIAIWGVVTYVIKRMR